MDFYVRYGKRLLDIGGSLTAFLILWPFLFIIPFIIKHDSPGPAIYSQERVGKDGQVFTIYKFRTMHYDRFAPAPTPTDDGDTRITRVGRFLRKCSLDELPQLLNVLKGEMSLVGPRPEMVFIARDYTSEQKKRLATKPGITGLWQLSPCRKEPIHHNLSYDFYYIDNLSFLLDLKIIAKTFSVMIKHNTI
jgi:lipopolysaccharide/colanic/teichoic acid biosynthesis glycosyltransferase